MGRISDIYGEYEILTSTLLLNHIKEHKGLQYNLVDFIGKTLPQLDETVKFSLIHGERYGVRSKYETVSNGIIYNLYDELITPLCGSLKVDPGSHFRYFARFLYEFYSVDKFHHNKLLIYLYYLFSKEPRESGNYLNNIFRIMKQAMLDEGALPIRVGVSGEAKDLYLDFLFDHDYTIKEIDQLSIPWLVLIRPRGQCNSLGVSAILQTLKELDHYL